MMVRDWRDVSPEALAPAFAAERERWSRTLSWDLADSLAIVDEGRRAGHVAGWVATDENDHVLGWTFYVLHDGVLQVGGLVASRPAVARSLIEATLESPEASVARSLSCFVFPDIDGIASALVRQRFALRETVYLARSLEGLVPSGAEAGIASPVADASLRPWQALDLARAVRLFGEAYQGVPGAQCFAPSGTREQWGQYIGQLVHALGCGRFDPAVSVVAPGADGRALDGAALATWIAPQTIHLAQLGVDAAARGRGLGGRLVSAVMHAARAAGAADITLMVDEGNQPARDLYARLGFTERARLVYGSRGARTRVAA